MTSKKEVLIKDAKFIGSFDNYLKCPKQAYPEYAFIGRSNVGKSSLINMLTGRKSLAKTSSTPGKTRIINFFLINDSWSLVDLPGYGYAKISKENREKFTKMIENYILNRKQLVSIFVLIDIRIPPQKIDLEFINWLGVNGQPFSLVFTKSDKCSKLEIVNNVEKFKKALMESWEVLPNIFISSSENKAGKEEILRHIEDTNRHVNIDIRNNDQ
jgi:GTP-binding protein